MENACLWWVQLSDPCYRPCNKGFYLAGISIVLSYSSQVWLGIEKMIVKHMLSENRADSLKKEQTTKLINLVIKLISF